MDESRPTEEVHRGTGDLDRLSSGEILERIVDEDALVAAAVRDALPRLTEACDLLTSALEANGRWINVGAGTSGRIGVLDAAEIPPTFGLDPGRVIGPYDTRYRGVALRSGARPYSLWMLQRALDCYRSLSTDDRARVDTAIEGTGWEPVLQYVPRHRLGKRDNSLVWSDSKPAG